MCLVIRNCPARVGDADSGSAEAGEVVLRRLVSTVRSARGLRSVLTVSEGVAFSRFNW